jgi:hypothetical protein
MTLELTDEQTAALSRLLRDTIAGDRYPLSPRIHVLQAVLDQLEPPPIREPFSPLKTYAPPRATAKRRR